MAIAPHGFTPSRFAEAPMATPPASVAFWMSTARMQRSSRDETAKVVTVELKSDSTCENSSGGGSAVRRLLPAPLLFQAVHADRQSAFGVDAPCLSGR